jgi:hypothetical protein
MCVYGWVHAAKKLQAESFAVEITQQELESGEKGKKILH